MERFLEEMVNRNPTRFSEEQLTRYTTNYSTRLGRVYKGVFSNDHPMAVKVLRSEERFKAEMQTMSMTHHINLVRLYGFRSHDGRHTLVYEFMENGSLRDYLSTHRASVGMAKVVTIATGVAKGLRYLHEECRYKILHLDIKPENVLLDRDLTSKLAGFGRACQGNHVDTRLTEWEKRDVYSFGILLLRILGRGSRSWENHRDFRRVVWTRYQADELMEHVGLYGSQDEQRRRRERVERMCKVAFWCIQWQPPQRPSMSKVVMMLQGDVTIQPPPNPFRNHAVAQALAAAIQPRGGRNNQGRY